MTRRRTTRDQRYDGPGLARADGVTRVSLAELVSARVEVRRLGLSIGGPVVAARAGGHLSRFRGPGVEYDESRAYVPGDDPRTMDWRVTARAAKPHVKVYREERERPLWLFVDQGPSMRFGTRVALKSVIAARAAALLGWMAVAHGDRVGGLIWHEGGLALRPPAGRERGLLALLRALADGPTSGADAEVPAVPPPEPAGPGRRSSAGGFVDSLRKLAGQVRPGSRVFLISDFADGRGGDDGWLNRLTEHSEVVLLFVYDPIEATAPPGGHWLVTDGRARRLLDLSSAGRRALYESRFVQHRDRLADLARRYGSHWIALSTAEPVGAALVQALGGRLPRGYGS